MYKIREGKPDTKVMNSTVSFTERLYLAHLVIFLWARPGKRLNLIIRLEVFYTLLLVSYY